MHQKDTERLRWHLYFELLHRLPGALSELEQCFKDMMRFSSSPSLPPHPDHKITLMAFCLGSLGFMIYRSRRKPRRDGPWAGLLGHAVMADDGVESAPGVGILCWIVGIQGSRNTPLVLKDKKTGLILALFKIHNDIIQQQREMQTFPYLLYITSEGPRERSRFQSSWSLMLGLNMCLWFVSC